VEAIICWKTMYTSKHAQELSALFDVHVHDVNVCTVSYYTDNRRRVVLRCS
jgi:hypothetical protein